ncbi:hypothetical protein [Rhodococcus oryzae]|uniref:hypothetical protein n=1 Tax=Rhodococcus oryzae TaxID=2571143 RepID=UPI003794FCC3
MISVMHLATELTLSPIPARPLVGSQGTDGMQSSERYLTRPVEWPTPRTDARSVASAVVISVVVLVAALVSVGSALEGAGAAARYSLLFCLLMVLTMMFGMVFRGSTHRGQDIRTSSINGSAVTQIRYSALVFHLMTAMMATITALCGGGAIEIYLNTRGEGFPGASVIFGAIGLFSASYLAAVLAGRLQRGSLMLSSDGIRQRGWSFESYLPWESVAGSTAVHHGFPETLVIAYSNALWERRYTTRLFRTDRLPLSPLIEIDTRQFAVDPVLLHHLVSFYANDPATRAELGTDAAITRARARDYP